MRPSLSPFEYGAYGTPSTRASVVVGGPHESSDGRAVTMEDSEIGILQADNIYAMKTVMGGDQKFVKTSAKIGGGDQMRSAPRRPLLSLSCSSSSFSSMHAMKIYSGKISDLISKLSL